MVILSCLQNNYLIKISCQIGHSHIISS